MEGHSITLHLYTKNISAHFVLFSLAVVSLNWYFLEPTDDFLLNKLDKCFGARLLRALKTQSFKLVITALEALKPWSQKELHYQCKFSYFLLSFFLPRVSLCDRRFLSFFACHLQLFSLGVLLFP